MSFINPEKIPVKVYRSTDQDAPRLDRTPNCVATIFKACLVTGYGDKQGAGWTMPFEDTNNGIKVLRPEVSAEQDFYLRLSNDTGQEITAQVYLNMSDENTGDLKLQCATPFKYAIGNKTGEKWVLIACNRAFWFIYETADRILKTQSATYFYCGDTAKNSIGDRAIYLKHTGGTWGAHDTDRYSIFSNGDSGGYSNGKLFNTRMNTVTAVNPQSIFTGRGEQSTQTLLAPCLLMLQQEVWGFPAFAPSTLKQHNFDEISSFERQFINFSTATQHSHNFYVPIDYWEF